MPVVSDSWPVHRSQLQPAISAKAESRSRRSSPPLAALMTKQGSKQTYYTIQLLADRERIPDAYRAYAYFRWVDDQLDEKLPGQAQRLAFLERQQAILWGDTPGALTAEERMVTHLLRHDPETHIGLHTYLRHMMAVMAFDTQRRGRLISASELAEYSRNLAIAVTEALHYFIGRTDCPSSDTNRYLAVTGAHITHMLRDAYEDTAAGYFNIAREFLDSHQLRVRDLDGDAYREWVKQRVKLARDCFETSRSTIAEVKNPRCRLAGYAYTARFEWVLDTIEREAYRLRPAYPERKGFTAMRQMGWSTFLMFTQALLRGNA